MEFSKILEQLDFYEFVSKKVKLTKSGYNRYRGLSPFKSEKTPSFYLDNDAKTWYCFSSNTGGGVIDYVMKTESVDRNSAIQFIKTYLGIEDEPVTVFQKMKKALKIAHEFFIKNDSDNNSVRYLISRGLQEKEAVKIAKKYELGICKNNDVYNYLKSHNIEQEIIGKIGIFNEQGVCKYINKMVIPIKNEYGEVISFTGRDITGQSKIKYMHGVNSELFKKSNVVWNLSTVRKMISEQDRVVVCEGQMDAISITEAGIPAVSVMGSRISEAQLKSISKLTNNVYMVFDSDSSGENGLIEAFKMISELDIDIVFYSIVLTEKDPDDYIRKNGIEKFNELIDKANPDTSHIINLILKKSLAKKTSQNKYAVIRKILSELKPYIKKSYTYRSLDMIERLSQELGLSRKELQKWIDEGTNFSYNDSTLEKIEKIHIPAPVFERRILYSVVKQPSLLNKISGSGISLYDLESPFVSKVLRNIESSMDTNAVMENLKSELTEEEYLMVVSFVTQGILEADFDTSLDILKAKIKMNVKKPAVDFLGRPMTKTQKEYRPVVGNVIRYEKEPF